MDRRARSVWLAAGSLVLAAPSAALVAVGSLELASSSNHVEVVAGRAYIGGGDGLVIVDVADPESPALLGSFATPGPVYSLDVEGNLAYLAGTNATGTSSELRVVDVSDPSAPEERGFFGFAGLVRDVEVVDGIAYLASVASDGLGGGWRIVDVSNPAAPLELGSFDGLSAQNIAVADGFAYVAHSNVSLEGSGLRIVDVTDPAAPDDMGRVPVAMFALDVEVADGLAYVLEGQLGRGVRVLDVSDPRNPQSLGALSATMDFSGYDLALGEGFVYVTGQAGLRTVDVSDPAAPAVAARLLVAEHRSVTVADGFAYTAGGFSERFLLVYDAARPRTPGELSRTELSSPANLAEDVVVEGSLAYVAAGEAGLLVFDVSDPSHPVELAQLDTAPTTAKDLELRGSLVYVAGSDEAGLDSGLGIVDVSDPAVPHQLGFLAMAGRAEAVDVQGTTAYLAGDPGGLVVIDVADPQTPVELGSLPGFGFVDVEVEGSQAHAVGRDSAVIGVSDPMQPSLISQEVAGNDVELRNGVRHVATSSGLATSAGGSLLLQAPEGGWDVELAGSQAWLATYFYDKPPDSAAAKLELLDVSDPASPEVLGILPYHRFESLRDVAVADGLAYVGMRGALSVVDFGPEYVPEPEPLRGRLAALATLVLLVGSCRRVPRGSGA